MSNAACFDQQIKKKTRKEKIKLVNGFFKSGIVQTWYLRWDILKLYLVRNYFYFFTYFLLDSDVIFTAVCKFEIPCEWETL